jgi:hypothetical protein
MSIAVAPARPGLISGPVSNICTGSVQNYGVSTVTGAESYSWTIPPATTILSATQNTKDIQLEFGPIPATGQLVMVSASNQCGTSQSRSLSGISTTNCLRDISTDGKLDWIIYPNPSKGEFIIDYVSPIDNDKLLLRLFTLDGRCVRIENLYTSTGKNKIRLNISDLASGSYILQAEGTLGIESVRLIKEE